MLPHTSIHRSIAKMSVDLHRAMEHRRSLTRDYEIGEHEQQYQYDFHGRVGILPVENTLTIPFGIIYVADPGNQRASYLDRPLAKLAIEMRRAPAGTLAYPHLARWKRDDDFNFVGAVIRVTVHCPAIAIEGLMPHDFTYDGILHAAFQGFGGPWDPDGPFDAGGTLDDTGAN